MDTGLLRQLNGKESTCQWRRLKRRKFDLWVGKIPWREIPWRRKWHPTPAFFPGESHGQRSLAGYSPWGHTVGHGWATEHTHTDRHNLFKQARLWVTPDPVTYVQATYMGGVRCRESVHGLKDTCSHSGQTDQQVLCKHSVPLISFYSWFFSLLFYVLPHDPCLLEDHTASEGGRKMFRKRGRGSAPGKPEGFQSFLGRQGEKTSKKDEGVGPFHIPSITKALITFTWCSSEQPGSL